ncbi:MAG: hypothetical protein WC859_00200 [Elusimicrobiota bacterium]|jgi:tetratricopeptide (TPR) repeat protein
MKRSQFRCLYAAAFLGLSPYSNSSTNIPQHLLETAKTQISINDKITYLKQLIQAFPSDELAKIARDHLVSLLAGSNRYEEALLEYRQYAPAPDTSAPIDFTLLECLLKTGRYNEVLQNTAVALNPVRDFLRDKRLLELRVQALLATGQYGNARENVENWLSLYAADGIEGSRFEGDVRSIQYLHRHLKTLERLNGQTGKALFTASVPDSHQQWSHQRNIPIYFVKLIPAHPAGQMYEPVLPGRHEIDSFFEDKVSEMNRGFDYLSGGEFSLSFGGLRTLYVREGDMDPTASGGHLLTSRVYAHSIPELYRLSGEAFVILVDYREQSTGEASYMGDGIIFLSASKFQPMTLMHEILHGMGATHQDWNYLQTQGYQFDSEDRGLMTFEKGEILDLGLETKNRATLGWPQVSVIRFGGADLAAVPRNTPINAEQPPKLTPVTVADGFIQRI